MSITFCPTFASRVRESDIKREPKDMQVFTSFANPKARQPSGLYEARIFYAQEHHNGSFYPAENEFSVELVTVATAFAKGSNKSTPVDLPVTVVILFTY